MSEKIDGIRDNIVTATIAGGMARMIVADTTDLVQKAQELHTTSATASAALGRALTAAAMMGSMLKGKKDTVSLQFKGDGPIGSVVAVSDSNANVRGYVGNPYVEIERRPDGKLNVGGAIGKGHMSVVKDLGMKDPYVGQIELINGEIGVDLTYYFASSEQTPSAVAVGVLVNPDLSIAHAGGYIIQLMPDCEDKLISYIENTIDHMPSITQLLGMGETPETLVDLFFAEKGFEILGKRSCQYKCICSKERMERGLISIGEKDLRELADADEVTECVCHFCNTKYHFTREDVNRLLDEGLNHK